ncbi:MAG: hypothetical protein ABII98_00465 [bacterium]
MKKIVIFALVASSFFALCLPVLADSYNLDKTAQKLNYDTSTKGDLNTKVQVVITVALSVLAILFFGLMLYAGVRWMTAMGKEEDVTRAKETVYAAIIGLVIIGASYAVATFIFGVLGG